MYFYTIPDGFDSELVIETTISRFESVPIVLIDGAAAIFCYLFWRLCIFLMFVFLAKTR